MGKQPDYYEIRAMVDLNLVVKYLQRYWITAFLFGYMVFSVLLKSYFAIDITIPCLIYYTTGERCLGCGLTTATSELLRFDIAAAYNSNPLVFIVLPILTYLFLNHWRQFQTSFKN